MFRDRADAGHQLADALKDYRGRTDLVLALPRGGVPVGFLVAQALGAPLDVLIVRKIGAPFHEELGVGALVSGNPPEVVWNENLLAQLGLTPEGLQRTVDRETQEARRRELLYRGDRPSPSVRGKSVILVDDGLATGITAQAALTALHRCHPKHLILAIPVAPPDTVERLRSLVDDLVCLDTPPWFSAVGQFYRDFAQTEDEEVIALLGVAKS